jgi:hypothetical protein
MMVALVSVETVLLVLLIVLVAGLLRSHAEILRRLGPGEEPIASPEPVQRRPGDEPAPAIAGHTPQGDALRLDFAGAGSAPTLLAFLSSGCSTCMGFWESLSEPRLEREVETVIVTHGADRERPAKLRALAPAGVPVVMSSQAWSDYRVPGAPYFVLVDGAIRGEGVATSWHALTSLVSDAIEDERAAHAQDLDARLAAGGIGPGHPSLYPGGRQP